MKPDSAPTLESPLVGFSAPRRRRQRIARQEWEVQHARLQQLYVDEDKSLQETRTILAQNHGFQATARQYKDKFKEWGFEKNIKASDMKIMLAKAEKRKVAEDKNTRFRVRGRDFEDENYYTPLAGQPPTPEAARNMENIIPLSPRPAHSVHDIGLASPILAIEDNVRSTAQHTLDAGTQTVAALDLLRLDWKGKDKKALDNVHDEAFGHAMRDEIDEAEVLFHQALCGYQCLLGPSSEEALRTLHHLGCIHTRQGRWMDAVSRFEQSIAGYIELHGQIHNDTLHTLAALANVYDEQKKFEDCEVLLSRVVAGYEELVGPHDHETLRQFLYLRAIDGYQMLDDLEGMAKSQGSLGVTLLEQELLEETEPFVLHAIALYEQLSRPDSGEYMDFLNSLQIKYLKHGRIDKLEPLLDKILNGLYKSLEPGRERASQGLNAGIMLAGTYSRLERYKVAQTLFLRVQPAQEALFGPTHGPTIAGLEEFGLHYQRQGKWKDAESCLMRAITAHGAVECERGSGCRSSVSLAREALGEVRTEMDWEENSQRSTLVTGAAEDSEMDWFASSDNELRLPPFIPDTDGIS
ncbi:MAG: hypothetical protein M1830_009850 [Pleopsidium flavum]|nr:MAG: hypothetical protein M1830_009850 [Pleopsidium flavum]